MNRLFKSFFCFIAVFFLIFSSIVQANFDGCELLSTVNLPRALIPQQESRTKIEAISFANTCPLSQHLLSEADLDEMSDFFSKCSIVDHFLTFNITELQPSSGFYFEFSSFNPSLPKSRAEWMSRYHSSLSPPASNTSC